MGDTMFKPKLTPCVGDRVVIIKNIGNALHKIGTIETIRNSSYPWPFGIRIPIPGGWMSFNTSRDKFAILK